MNKKKLVVMVSALIVAAATVAGGTLAYFTHSAQAVNTLTMGNVEITLTEPAYKPENSQNITPGRLIPKDPTITNIGNNDCYLRVKLDAVLKDKSGNVVNSLPVNPSDLVTILPNWTKGTGDEQGYYYYNSKVAKAGTATVFKSMTVPTGWDNKYQGLTLELKVTAHAIQADNFTPDSDSKGNITGWGNVNIEK